MRPGGEDAVAETTCSSPCSSDAASSGHLHRVLEDFARRTTQPAATDREGRLAPAAVGAAKELGLFALSIPLPFGGLGLDLGGVCSAIETLAFHDRALATCVGLHNGLGTRGLVAFRSPFLRAVWLPRLARGEPIAAFAAPPA